MTSRRLPFGWLWGCALFFWQCSSNYYVPASMHLPATTSRNSAQVWGSINTGLFDYFGWELGAVYQPLRHFQAGFLSSNTGQFDPRNKLLRRTGYSRWNQCTFTPVFDVRERWFVSTGLGFGWGQSRNIFYYSSNYVHLRYHRFFAQPGVVRVGEKLDLGLGARVGLLRIPDGAASLDLPEEQKKHLNAMYAVNYIGVAEVGGFVCWKIKQYRLNLTMVSLNANAASKYNFARWNLGLGCGYVFKGK